MVVHRLDPQARAVVAVVERLARAAQVVPRRIDLHFGLALGAVHVHADRPAHQARYRERADAKAVAVQRADRFEAMALLVHVVPHRGQPIICADE